MGILSNISLETKLLAAAGVIVYVVARRFLHQMGSDMGRVKKVVSSLSFCCSPFQAIVGATLRSPLPLYSFNSN